MKRFAWEITNMDGYIALICFDSADSYIVKEYYGPIVGYVFINSDDTISFTVDNDSIRDAETLKKRSKLLALFKKEYDIRKLYCRDEIFYLEGAYQQFSQKISKTV